VDRRVNSYHTLAVPIRQTYAKNQSGTHLSPATTMQVSDIHRTDDEESITVSTEHADVVIVEDQAEVVIAAEPTPTTTHYTRISDDDLDSWTDTEADEQRGEQ